MMRTAGGLFKRHSFRSLLSRKGDSHQQNLVKGAL
jgi:hypothetical protein